MIHISPKKRSLSQFLLQVWTQRRLLWLLSKRDWSIKYQQTPWGWAWAIAQPLSLLAVFSLVFGQWVMPEKNDIPYPVFALCGLAVWTCFQYGLNQGAWAIWNQRELAKSIQGPAVLLIFSKICLALWEAGLVFLLWIISLSFHPQSFSFSLLLFPLLMAPVLLFSTGASLLFSAWSVKAKNIHHTLPLIASLALWLSPVFYPTFLLPEKWSFIIWMNPITSSVEGIRWAAGISSLNSKMLWGWGLSFIIFLCGIHFYRKKESALLDQL